MNNLFKNIILSPFNLIYKLNPEINLKILYKFKTGAKLNLENPIGYNEKLQWIKLYDKNKLMPKCCDKFKVREYVEKQGCAEILNELYWQGFNPEDIPFDILPDKFVIKVTHGSTFNIICKNKHELDRKKTIKKLNKWLNVKFLPCYGEWFYGIEKPRIIVEKYLEDSYSKELKDYKIFCFNGKAKYIRVDSGRFTKNHCKDIYDVEWNLQKDVEMGYKCSNMEINKPNELEKMLKYAEVLSNKFLHARVDFYIVDGKIIFGEITFTNGAGFDKITPKEFDIKLGSLLKLNN